VADRHIQLVFSNPYEGKDDEFNEWYDNVHLPEVLAVPGMISAERFDLRPLAREAGTTPEFRYLAIYELEGDPDVILAKIGEGVQSGTIVLSDTFDRMGSRLSFWAPRGERPASE
jgi:hypothetical protein